MKERGKRRKESTKVDAFIPLLVFLIPVTKQIQRVVRKRRRRNQRERERRRNQRERERRRNQRERKKRRKFWRVIAQI